MLLYFSDEISDVQCAAYNSLSCPSFRIISLLEYLDCVKGMALTIKNRSLKKMNATKMSRKVKYGDGGLLVSWW